MEVRLGTLDDCDVVCDMARRNIEETRVGMEFDLERCRRSYASYLATAEPTIFVCEDKGQVIGFTLSSLNAYRAASGLYTTQEVLYVVPEKRGSRAAVLLMKNLIAWSQMLGAKEIIGGNDNRFNSDRTARFLEHFGFEEVGNAMRRVLT